MSLINNAAVKTKFPLWESFLLDIADTSGQSTDELLTLSREEAEHEMQNFLDLENEDDMTDRLTDHLMTIIRYRVFLQKHGDTEFEKAPGIVREYKKIRKLLDSGRIGSDRISITTRDRIMDVSFLDSADTTTDSENLGR